MSSSIIPPPPSLPSTSNKKACHHQLTAMDHRYRQQIKHLNDEMDQLRDVNHYLVEKNQRLLMTINLMRSPANVVKSHSSPSKLSF